MPPQRSEILDRFGGDYRFRFHTGQECFLNPFRGGERLAVAFFLFRYPIGISQNTCRACKFSTFFVSCHKNLLYGTFDSFHFHFLFRRVCPEGLATVFLHYNPRGRLLLTRIGRTGFGESRMTISAGFAGSGYFTIQGCSKGPNARQPAGRQELSSFLCAG